MSYERSIKEAFDKISGEIIKADDVFDEVKDGFKIRKKFHKNEIELFCCECEQKLNVSTSKYDRLHFKHAPHAKPCLLKDSNLSPEESEKLYSIYKSKESPRHKELKNKIAKALSRIDGVTSISIDDKFIFDGDQKRKPDVYCKFLDKELVFEIQLSDLSLRYILNRYDFYKRNRMYLIWILDNLDIHSQSQTARDIKYLTEFENFFKFDEDYEDFSLSCTYKVPFLNYNNRMQTKWIEKSICLDQVKFSTEFYQIYYYDFGKNKKLKEEDQKKIEEQREDEERIQIEKERNERANEIIELIINDLRKLWKGETFNTILIKKRIKELDDFQLSVFNKSSAFEPKNGQPRLHFWLSIAKKEHYSFLDFVFDCKEIDLDFNERSIDEKTVMVSLFENIFLSDKIHLAIKMLKRGYIFTKEDELLISGLGYELKYKQTIAILFNLANQLEDKFLIDKLFEHSTLFCTIESAKRGGIIGFGYKPNEWIAFANNAIHSYKEYWEYTEIAFKQYGIWEQLISLDKNGTFQKKLNIYYLEKPLQRFDCDRIFRLLYPELN